jgi:hypothetical protein
VDLANHMPKEHGSAHQARTGPINYKDTKQWARELVREIRRNGRWRQQGFGALQLVRRQQPLASSSVNVPDTLSCWMQCYSDILATSNLFISHAHRSKGRTSCRRDYEPLPDARRLDTICLITWAYDATRLFRIAGIFRYTFTMTRHFSTKVKKRLLLALVAFLPACALVLCRRRCWAASRP